jgi:hypothetical protein
MSCSLDIGRERPSKLYSSTRQDFADLDQPNLHVAVRDRSLHIQGLALGPRLVCNDKLGEQRFQCRGGGRLIDITDRFGV